MRCFTLTIMKIFIFPLLNISNKIFLNFKRKTCHFTIIPYFLAFNTFIKYI